jgi:cobalt-zinc-cadmium resistance protein CzcA
MNDVIYQVSETYFHLMYLKEKHHLLLREDSLYRALVTATSLRYSVGESTLLEKTSFETQLQEVMNKVNQNDAKIKIHQAQLMALLNAENLIDSNMPLEVIHIDFDLDTATTQSNPFITHLRKEILTAEQQKKYEVAKVLPDLKIGFFSQTLIGEQFINGQDVYFGSDKRFTGFEVGLAIPIFFGSHKAQVKNAELNKEIAETNLQGYQNKIKSELDQTIQEFGANKNSLEYYQNTAIPNANLIERQAYLAFRNGEIDYTTLLLNINQVVALHHNYVETILNYNLSIIRLEYLIGNTTQ